MGHRSKVLDTEGPTPKFLFAIIKQLDLKAIDWNKVAAELEISNGHAARMRYSRFRNQMEGPLGHRGGKKKAAKKAKDDLKAAMQAAPYVPPPEVNLKREPVEPKSEPMDSSYATPPHTKPEPGNHNGLVDQPFHDTPENYQMFQPVPRSYDGAPQPISHNMQLGMPYHFPDMSSPMESQMSSSMQYASPSPFGYPYPTYESADISMNDFGFQTPPFPNAPMTPMTPMTPWEPPVATQTEARPTLAPQARFTPQPTPTPQPMPQPMPDGRQPAIKIEDDVEILEYKVEKADIQNVAKSEAL